MTGRFGSAYDWSTKPSYFIGSKTLCRVNISRLSMVSSMSLRPCRYFFFGSFRYLMKLLLFLYFQSQQEHQPTSKSSPVLPLL